MPRSNVELAIHILESSYRVMIGHLDDLTLEEAFFVPPGGYRSVLGTLKHAAGWSHVYRSYAFDVQPVHWKNIDWPLGLRDSVVRSEEYVSAVVEWFHEAHKRWVANLTPLQDDQMEKSHRLHWGEERPLFDIVAMISRHHVYHAGELNQILSISRGEAWEEGEEVEENNISTIGHRVKPPWLDEEGS
jgi:hypothetical protein